MSIQQTMADSFEAAFIGLIQKPPTQADAMARLSVALQDRRDALLSLAADLDYLAHIAGGTREFDDLNPTMRVLVDIGHTSDREAQLLAENKKLRLALGKIFSNCKHENGFYLISAETMAEILDG